MENSTEKNTEPTTPKTDNGIVLRIPKMNLQAVLLGLVALITIFQTVQLFRINNGTASAQVRSSVSPTQSSSGSSGANANAPQSMVGGC